MTEARLKTEIWVQACIRQASVSGSIAMIVARGDRDSGAVLVKLNQFEQGCLVLVETRDAAGERAWFRATGPTLVAESIADAYIARNRQRDPDLWVIEVEDRAGRLPFEARILPA